MMKPYAKLFDHALPFPFCDEMILYFEHNTVRHVKQQFDKIRNFTEMEIGEKELRMQNTLIDAQDSILKKYREDCELADYQFPAAYGYETFRIKRYLPNTEEHFGMHTDVGDHATAKRFIAFLWYLNDVEEGGETLLYGQRIHPKKGSVLVFPPLWTVPHAGLPPISGPKYIISSYTHYL